MTVDSVGSNGSTASYLRNTWYVAMWSADLAPNALVTRTILDEPLVFWRRSDGAPVAFEDRCPHRFAPLSMGSIHGDVLRCGYHGLEFDTGGMCVRNPHPNRAIIPGTKTRAYPVREKHSLLWIWMGEEPADGSIPDFSLLDTAPPEHVSARDYLLMAANAELIVDNLLDLSHASYLHDGLLGNEAMVESKTDVARDGNTLVVSRFTPGVPVPEVFDLLFRQDGRTVDLWTSIRWDPPACLINDAGVCAPGDARSNGTGVFGMHFLTPQTATTTHYHFCAVRQRPLDRAGAENERIRERLTTLRRRAFEDQDCAMIEAQQRNIMRKPHARPALLSVDAGAVRHYRILEELSVAERTAHSPEARQ